jgi:flavodoxin
MKTIILYDSLYGNTRKVAENIGSVLKLSSSSIISVKDAKIDNIKKCELLVTGSPTHGGWYTEAFKKFFSKIKDGDLNNIKVAVFSTGTSKDNEGTFIKFVINMFGYATEKLAKDFEKKGANVIAKNTFLVKGKEGPLRPKELDRAKKWANEIKLTIK